MRAESNQRPESVIIERTSAGLCDVIINTNISDALTKTMFMGDEETTTEYYEYDSYRFELKYRTGLLEEIKSNLDTWIEYAKKDAELPVELSDKEKIEYLLNENRSLSSDNEMLKGCIMEIADVVFA
nr:MAG TPA: hypothetical protein [Caudoviricetes sp.]